MVRTYGTNLRRMLSSATAGTLSSGGGGGAQRGGSRGPSSLRSGASRPPVLRPPGRDAESWPRPGFSPKGALLRRQHGRPESRPHPLGIGRIDLGEMRQLTLDDFPGYALHQGGDVAEQPLALASIEQAEQRGDLAVVVIAVPVVIPIGISRDPQRRLLHRGLLLRAIERVRLVIGIRIAAVVASEPHRAVLIIIMHRNERSVHRQRLVMRADPVAVRVGIRENARLQHFVGTE